jgi:hypothetical protein
MYNFEDLSIFFTDFAEPIAWNGQSLLCIFDSKHDPLNFNGGGRSITAIVRTSQFGALAQGQTVTIRGNSYSVEEIHPIQNGDLLKLILEQG